MTSVPSQPNPQPQQILPDKLFLGACPEKLALPLPALGRQLRVGYVPGIMPDKWFGRWNERYRSSCPLEAFALAEGQASLALSQQVNDQALVHMVLLRPESQGQDHNRTENLHLVTLYREQQVVVLPQDHTLTLYQQVPLEELADQDLLRAPDSPPDLAGRLLGGQQEKDYLLDTAQTLELVAAGLGLAVLPLSLARVYHRKDLTYRPVEGLATSPVALAWPRHCYSPQEEAILQDFVGICRGRTAGSQRSSQDRLEAQKPVPAKKSAQRPSRSGKRATPSRQKKVRRQRSSRATQGKSGR